MFKGGLVPGGQEMGNFASQVVIHSEVQPDFWTTAKWLAGAISTSKPKLLTKGDIFGLRPLKIS